jgi:hypothetical protein
MIRNKHSESYVHYIFVQKTLHRCPITIDDHFELVFENGFLESSRKIFLFFRLFKDKKRDNRNIRAKMESSTISSLQEEANNLKLVDSMFIKYFCFVIIPPSVLGHFISFYVFTRPSLRSNPCGMYFLSATLFGFLNASFILPMQLVQTNYGYADPTVRSNAACKIIWLFMYSIR